MVSASIPKDLKTSNRKNVLKAFHNSGALSIADVSEKTNLSRQTVKKCIEYYIENGVIEEYGKGQSTSIGGKRPILYQLSSNLLLVSINLHHHDIVISLSDLHYNIISKWSSEYVNLKSMDHMFEIIKKGAIYILKACGDSKIIELCFSVPLGYSYDGKLTTATPFPLWPNSDYGRSIVEPLKQIFSDVQYFELLSDGYAAGSAVLYNNYALFAQDTTMTLYTSEGIGGALFRKGEPQNRNKNVVGAFGHIIVDVQDEELCSCGDRGCLESFCNIKRLQNLIKTKKNEYSESILSKIDINNINFFDVFDGSSKGDSFCRFVSKYYARMFAIAIRNAMVIAGPTHVVFQGVFGKADDVFKAEVINYINKFRYVECYGVLEIHYDTRELIAEEIIGSCYHMIKRFISNPERYLI
ncbi:MAG: ROK family protein [Christensenellaceae bacterium]|nr:ROK family protein [Christensenellaceae bacterium]